MNQQSFFASLVLISAFPVCFVLFSNLRPMRAALAMVLGGALLLPELAGFKVPLMPNLTKTNIVYLAILLVCALRSPKILRRPIDKWFLVLCVVTVAGSIGTALTNDDTFLYGHGLRAAGLTIKDGMFIALTSLFSCALPFFLGSKLVRSSKDLDDLFAGLVLAGLVYSVFALFEVRMSPQLHRWVYGYVQMVDFSQAKRWGGYRPVVFMAHGIALGLFFCVTTIAASTLATVRRTFWRFRTSAVAIYLFVVLVLCKSTAAIIYGIFCIPLLKLAKPALRSRIAATMAALVLLYPVLRAADLFPVDKVREWSMAISSDREQSMAFRFSNEEVLLARARERIWFGWGHGRNLMLPSTKDGVAPTADGAWIILLGMGGATLFIAEFGLLLIPVMLTGRRLSRITDKRDQTLLVSLSLIVAVLSVDLIPNGLFANYPYFLAGALSALTRTLSVRAEPSKRSAPLAPLPTDRPDRAYG